ncbi:hypothetical protein C8J57DRAFT_79867 [Mycena rebaudengoi]|nr:hypothetical protein C8J57DRAFT_79867 [Mycena rebaudengoi]
MPPPITPPSASHITDLADLSLHSPSQIVGTPFSDTNSARFEYPFPDKSASSSPELYSTNSVPLISPTFSSISPPSSSLAIMSASQPQLVLNSPPSSLHHFPASFPPPPDLPNYSPTHPKMRTVNPPVPPALVKRRQRWSLGLGSLSRKISLRSGSAPTQPNTSGGALDADVHPRRTMSDERAGGSKSAMDALANPIAEDVVQDDRTGGRGDDTGPYT